jgi:radical SAM superfamily enzyme YgiQ (UPF0313 family)
MRVRTHLIAMPWAAPDAPSIQLACLKAHLDRALQRRGECRAYSAFFSILHDFKGRAFQEFFQAVEDYREYVYLPLYLRRFGPAEFRRRSAIARMLKALRVSWAKPLSLAMLNGLERATGRYLDRHVAPNLIARGLNLVGFTLNFPQVYSSLYAAEHLRQRFPARHFLFVYGGCSASLPTVYSLLTDLGVPGVIVVGEGEKKLELLVRTFEGLPLAEAQTALAAVAGLDPGIIVIGEKVDLGVRNPAHYATQVKSLSELALPDYDEYFAALRLACADEKAYAAFRAATDVLVEGSRGCFAKCDFCGLNRVWQGFRKRSADQVVRDTLALTRKYHTSQVMFVDNVCDTWAEEYARLLVQRGIRQRSFMELRANHPEPFWTLLALAGLANVQVGVEAISAPLLKAIGKGTRVVHNLTAHKYLSELGVWPTNHLITHHPASTVADIRETRRILRQIPHWSPFRPIEFELIPGSPRYEGLSEDERAALKPTRRFRLPSAAARYALDYWFETPERLKPGRAVRRAWSAFARQYARARARHEAERPRLDVARVAPDTLRLTDTRDGQRRFYEFSGAAARIYDACHGGVKLEAIAQATGLPPETVTATLARFLRLKLVLRVEDCYLSLALRPRDELLRRFFATRGSSGDSSPGGPRPAAQDGEPGLRS